MVQPKDSPSNRGYSPFICEQAIVTDVNRKTWTVTVETVHTRKTLADVQVLMPYHHWEAGEGFSALPEVGARCMLGSPNDNSPPLIMGFTAPPRVRTAAGNEPERSTAQGGSGTDVSYASKREGRNPGDVGITGRDGNFFWLNRGGVLELGASGMCQRVFVPLRNYMHDFCENYALHTLGGDWGWTVERSELDPSGRAACAHSFTLREYSSDALASVRVQHMPLGANKAAWQVEVAPQRIPLDGGAAVAPVYSLLVAMDGEQTEFIGGNRSITVTGNDSLTVTGNQSTTVTGSAELTVGTNLALVAQIVASLEGAKVALGAADATEPLLKGLAFQAWMSTAVFQVTGATAVLSPASAATLMQALSTTVFTK